MSQMEQGMETIIKTFHQHAGKEGNPDTLSKKEFKQLVNKDMPNSLKKVKKDERAMNHMMEDLDRNKDGEVDFDEFVALLAKRLLMTGINDCSTSFRGCTAILGNFAKAAFDAISKTYSYLTPDL
ncbi:Protein S100-A9 [Cricetulus griseus]|uniref:Protein S100 n=1 Tax=Cricetulus griseus TaxID=10029 RepID=G3I8A7_CRIGR|nr:Protein S100-A9 [Cricetulus griseus]